ncbi:MAG: peptidylprolyl isomerase [Lachnospiraceae bacterium]|nr:peptidylprolyl isomerase [Lachnospiraceae bacterium]
MGNNCANPKPHKILRGAVYAALILLLSFLTACGDRPKTEIILTTDFKEGEVFRIENTSCYLPEIMVYLVNSENRYDEIFGEQIWKVPIDDSTVGDAYKETILARIAQIKVMNLLAKDYEVSLTEEEEALVDAAADEYFRSLTPEEVDIMNVSVQTIRQLYQEFAIANKLYLTITEAVQPEISDDEARAVSVRSILIKTYSMTNGGTRIEFTQQQREEAYNRAQDALAKIRTGTDFDIVAADYNEDSESEYSFGRGVMPVAFEQVAFNLDNGEVSDIIETEYGYHIIMCTSSFDRDETDANKAGILKKRQQEEFNIIYEQFVKTLTANLNAPLWESVTYEKSPAVNTTSFFEVYDRYFAAEES